MNAAHTLAQRQRRIARLYRARAHEALARAREARQYGQLMAARGYLDEACFWRVASHDWSRKARRTLAFTAVSVRLQ
jgi:hypothetical protein